VTAANPESEDPMATTCSNPQVEHPGFPCNHPDTCVDCGASVDYLEVFPGPRCQTCYEPIGERQFRTMTADDLTAMWGGPVKRTRRR
jgi:hypothetical protein